MYTSVADSSWFSHMIECISDTKQHALVDPSHFALPWSKQKHLLSPTVNHAGEGGRATRMYSVGLRDIDTRMREGVLACG